MSLKAFIAGLTLKMKIMFAVAAIAVVGGTAAVVGYNVTKEDAYRVLKVFEMEGASIVSREGSGDLEAYVGMNLESGDVLSVGDESTLRIVLDNDKYILLDGGTVLELIAAGTEADSRTTINLKQGAILNEITNPLSANSSYEVNAPKATMAVRGTSFSVSVKDDGNGGYDINETTYHGLVNVSIFDEKGNIIQSADVGVDKGVDIHTSKNENTGNPAEKDGRAEFVIIDENGNISSLGDGESPVHDALYDFVPMLIRSRVVESNNTNLMDIEQNVIKRIMGGGSFVESNAGDGTGGGKYIEDPANDGTGGGIYSGDSFGGKMNGNETKISAPETEPETVPETVPETSAPETEPETIPETSAPETEPETVPETSAPETEPETVPETSAPETEAPETSVPETEAAEMTAPETEDYDGVIITDEVEKPITKPKTDSDNNDTVTSRPNTVTAAPSVPDYVYPPQTSAATSAPETTVPTETSADESTETSADETVYYEVSFVCDGEVIYSEEVKSGETVSTVPAIPEKAGYESMWIYGSGDDVAAFTYDTVVTEDMTVTALYTVIPSEYATVTYYASYDSTTPIATEQVAIGSRPTGATVPQYDSGKAWLIWGFSAAELPVVEKDMDITVPYVAYSKVVEVLLVDGNGSTVLNKLVLIGTSVTLPEMRPTLDGVAFAGWGKTQSGFLDGSGLKPGSSGTDSSTKPTVLSNSAGDTVTIEENVKYYAIYKDKHTVTFKIGDKVVYQTEEYTDSWLWYSTISSKIASISMDDYRWFYTNESDAEQQFSSDSESPLPLVVYGDIKVSAKPYSITFVNVDGTETSVTSYSNKFVLESGYGGEFNYGGNTYLAGDKITLTEDSTTITVTS